MSQNTEPGASAPAVLDVPRLQALLHNIARDNGSSAQACRNLAKRGESFAEYAAEAEEHEQKAADCLALAAALPALVEAGALLDRTNERLGEYADADQGEFGCVDGVVFVSLPGQFDGPGFGSNIRDALLDALGSTHVHQLEAAEASGAPRGGLMARPKKQTKLVRLSDRSHVTAKRLADECHLSIGDVLEQAINLLYTATFGASPSVLGEEASRE